MQQDRTKNQQNFRLSKLMPEDTIMGIKVPTPCLPCTDKSEDEGSRPSEYILKKVDARVAPKRMRSVVL